MAEAREIAQSAIVEMACEWLITLQEDPVPRSARHRFVAWLLESPAHVREYLAAEITWSLVGNIIKNNQIDPEVQSAISTAIVRNLPVA